jgi:outer membrane receptor protein involved in Fe transport
MNRLFRIGAVCCLALLMAVPVWAASTGKIAGRVLDESGEAVIGANVQVTELQMGATVDADGNYHILGVVPGSYTVRITCVGYAAQTYKDVKVSGDLTTTLNAKLKEEALQVGEQVIEYQAPVVKVDVSSKEVRITGKEMESRAFTNIAGLLKKQPGFKVDPEGALHVRGGRASELLVKVDGVDFRDPLVTSSKQLVNLSALNVEEIEVLTGGDARYGGFQSALINVTTPEGSMTKYAGTFEWRNDRILPQKEETYHGVNRRINNFNTDQYDYSLSGPVPFAEKLLGKEKLSFFTSGTARLTNTYTPYSVLRQPNDYMNIGFNLPERQNNEYSTFWKLTYRLDRTKKLNLTYQRDFSKWDVYPDGEASIDGNYGWQYKYDVANRPFCETNRQVISLQFSHNVSKNTLYEVSLGNTSFKTQVKPRGKAPDQFTLTSGAEDQNRRFVGSVDADKDGFPDGYVDANRNGQYDGTGEGYNDINNNGRWDRGEDWVDLNGNGVYDQAEPWTDKPNAQGVNNIGVYDPWDPYVDLNHNGRWDPAEPQLPEQDWNHNGYWDGEPFIDANSNGRYDGSGEGFDDKNRNGAMDKTTNLDPSTSDVAEPFIDGDYWNDTGEPFVDMPDANGYYNGVYDEGEIWYDLPSSFQGPYLGRGVPATNGVYDGPNGYFDEYELFTVPAVLTFNMDSRYPVLYTWEDIRNGIRNGGREWLNLPYIPASDGSFIPGYLSYFSDICPWTGTPISTWTNVTTYDQSRQVFDIPNNMWDRGKEWYNDYNQNGQQDPLPDFFLNPGLWDFSSNWMKRSSSEWYAKLDLTSQVNKYHELKSGFQIKYSNLEMNSIRNPSDPYTNTEVPLPAGSPYPDRGGIRDFYKHRPWEGSAYFQDKMEFEGMIVRAGLRGDFIIQPNELLQTTQTQLDQSQPGALLAKRGDFVLAPRLGISHPVSTKSKLYFNYGHYYQAPSFQYYYRNATANISPNTEIGNPNLKYEKTVSYEVGVNTEFAEDWVANVAGYYRDVYDQIGTVEQREGPIVLNRYFNLGYARARGFEFSVEKKFSSMWALTLNYDFSYAYGKESAATEGLLQRAGIGLPENRDEHPLNWDQTHSVSAFVTLMISDKDHPRPIGVRIPNDWLSTVEFTYGSGYPYTPSIYTTGKLASLILTNSARMPESVNVDWKFDKFWNIAKGIRLATGFEIYNLFDRRNIRSIYTETGNFYDSTHQNDLTARPDGNLGTDFDHNPRNLSPGRQVLLHLKITV